MMSANESAVVVRCFKAVPTIPPFSSFAIEALSPSKWSLFSAVMAGVGAGSLSLLLSIQSSSLQHLEIGLVVKRRSLFSLPFLC